MSTVTQGGKIVAPRTLANQEVGFYEPRDSWVLHGLVSSGTLQMLRDKARAIVGYVVQHYREHRNYSWDGIKTWSSLKKQPHHSNDPVADTNVFQEKMERY